MKRMARKNICEKCNTNNASVFCKHCNSALCFYCDVYKFTEEKGLCHECDLLLDLRDFKHGYTNNKCYCNECLYRQGRVKDERERNKARNQDVPSFPVKIQ